MWVTAVGNSTYAKRKREQGRKKKRRGFIKFESKL
jgi:hypothetical protein